MSRYPIEKYKIVIHKHPDYATTEIIAMSTYAGQVVKGKAICHINDIYDEEKGKKLAIARCAAKIAKKRNDRANRLLAKALKQKEMAEKYVADMARYQADAFNERKEIEAELADILAKM